MMNKRSDGKMQLFPKNKQNVSEDNTMEYFFNRKYTVNNEPEGHSCTREWDSINTQLRNNLDGILEKKYTETELASYIKKAIHDGKPLPKNHEMIFWEFDAPESMPADARCDFVYLPTYLMVLSMVAAINQYPDLMDISGIRDTLSRGLSACGGRGLKGSGYESMEILLQNVQMFTRAGIKQFLAEHPESSLGFKEMFEGTITGIRSAYNNGVHIFDWSSDFKEIQRETVEMYDAK